MDNVRPSVGTGCIIVKDGKVLLAKRKGAHGEGSYGCFGGHVENGETMEEALKREGKEELGIDVEIVKFLCCINMIKYGKHYIDLEFLAEIKKGNPKITEPERVESVGWFPLDKLPEPLFEPLRRAIESYKTGKVFYEVRD